MLRLATDADFDAVKRLAHSFFDASPYKELGIDDDRVAELITVFLQAPKRDKVLILWATPEPVGVLAAAAETNLFNRRRMAGELIWWIDPEARKAKAAGEMVRAYEYWAANVGCQICTLVDLLGNLDGYYTRKGYERRETSYVKVL